MSVDRDILEEAGMRYSLFLDRAYSLFLERKLSTMTDKKLKTIVIFEPETSYSRKAAILELKLRQELEDYMNDSPLDIIAEARMHFWNTGTR